MEAPQDNAILKSLKVDRDREHELRAVLTQVDLMQVVHRSYIASDRRSNERGDGTLWVRWTA